jgi:hypothetical protein
MMLHALLFSMSLCVGMAQHSGYSVDLGWPSGFCHVRMVGGAVLVQVEEKALSPLGWPRAPIEPFWCGRFDSTNFEFVIPCCRGSLIAVRRFHLFGIEVGNGRHWASGSRYYWIAFPSGHWRIDAL